MTKQGDSFVAEDFLRAKKGDVFLWTTASLLVIAGLVGGYWAYQTFVPVEEAAGPPAGAMVVEFAEFAVSPVTEETELPEGELSAASEATPPSEAEPDPEAEPIEEPEPVVEPPPEAEPEEVAAPEEAAEREEVIETAEAEVEPQPEAVEPEPPVETKPEPEPVPEPEPAVVPEPVEPIIDVPEVDVPEPAVVIQRQMATVERPEPEPEPEPVVEPEEIVEPPEPIPEPVPEPAPAEPVDPNLPVPVTMSPRIAETRENTPVTKFTPPPRRAPPPQQAAAQASAPKPQEQQAPQAAAPQQTASAEPSASQVNSWQSSVQRHIARRQKYPAGAERRREKGFVTVRFTIDREGNVRSATIAGSSGFASLDQAGLDLIYASSPLPRPPEGLPDWGLTIGMPLEYDFNR